MDRGYTVLLFIVVTYMCELVCRRNVSITQMGDIQTTRQLLGRRSQGQSENALVLEVLHHGFRPRADVEFPVNAAKMSAHCLNAETQCFGDFLVAITFG